jgi:hypothetical protein
MFHPSMVISPILKLILVLALWHKGDNGMRKLFVLFAGDCNGRDDRC